MSGKARGLCTKILSYLELAGPSSGAQIGAALDESLRAVTSGCGQLKARGQIESTKSTARTAHERRVTIWKVSGDDRCPLAPVKTDRRSSNPVSPHVLSTLDEQREWLEAVQRQIALRKKRAKMNSLL